jgi:hypothetical protein
MAIQNFFTSRDNNLDGNTNVGQLGRLWYNPDTNSIYASDGVTAGGIPVDLATGANITANVITVNTITSTSGTVAVTGNLTITGNISPASNVKIGGISAGPGVVISNEGVLTIDSANLPVSFGNFTANNNILSIVNVDENMILETQGDAEIQLVGNVGFYKPNGGGAPDPSALFFFARDDGQIKMLVPDEDPLEGAVEIIGSTSGTSVSPAVGGVMLHVTGQANTASSIYNDGIGSNPNFIGRRFNGNVITPTQVLAGQSIVRFSGQGYSTGGFNAPADGTISLDALDNFTQTAQGAIWRFLVNPVGGNVRQEVANISVANGVVATQFNTSGTVSATGNITGGNLTLTTGGILSSSGLISTTANVSAGNVSVSGLASVTGNVTGGNLITAGLASITGNVTAGNVNSRVTLPAGIASQAPLMFTVGVLETTPSIGAMNYDGIVFYATPQDDERGLIVTEQLFIPNSDYPLLNQTAVQNLFGAVTTVSSNTRYAYRIMSVIYKVSNNISLQYAMGGNATVARHTYESSTTATAALATASTPTVTKNVVTTGFSTPVTVSAALNGTGYFGLTVTGTLNVTTGGTWYPEIGFTGLPGVGSNVFAGSSIELWPIGPTGANVSIGNWS